MRLPESFRGAALVTRGDGVLLEQYCDRADVTSGEPCTAATRFQLSSVSKQFVAACALLLDTRGVLSVDDPVGAWVPSSPPSWNEITLADLMTHTAGLGHWPDYTEIDPTQPIDDAPFVAALQQRPLPEPLPAPHLYSSPGYGLLARIIERASAMPYATFVTDNVFGPLQMIESFVGNARHDRADLARGHHGDEPVPSWELDTGSKGAGDVWTTARDLDRWDRALCADTLLPDAARARMFAPSAPIEGLPTVTGYGFGWLIAEINGRAVYEHGGDNPGYWSFDAIVPAVQGRVIVFTNDETADVFTPAMEFLDTVTRGGS